MLHKNIKKSEFIKSLFDTNQNTETNKTSTTKKRKERLIVPFEKLSKGSWTA